MKTTTVSREDIRESILDAVGRLIIRYGYRKTTVDDIAVEAGIGKGTIYLYFPSKEEIALSWIDRSHYRLLTKFTQIVESDGTPDQKLRVMLLTRIMHSFDAAQNLVHSLDELFASIRMSLLERRNEHYKEQAQIMSAILEDGREMGVFTINDPFAVAECMLLATNSLLPYSLSTAQLGQREEIESKTLRIIELLLTGLLRRDAH